METLLKDLRYAVRRLLKSPGFTAVTVLTLALGIGANTVMFSIVKTVLLDPLPYPDAGELVVIGERHWIPAEIVLDLMQVEGSFKDVAAYYPQSFTVTGAEQPLALHGARVTPNFFHLLGANMALGRGFTEADARPDASRTVVIDFDRWQQHYGGSRDVIGRTLRIDGVPHEISGVLDRGFRSLVPRGEDTSLWIPFEVEATNTEGLNNGLNYVIPIARLQAGVSPKQAQSALEVATSRFKARHPEMFPDSSRWSPHWATLKSELVKDAGGALLVLQLAVGVVLLIACANVANLLLARFASRRQETAIRLALGASGGRVLRQLLMESLVLAVLGGLLGLLVIALGLELILALAPQGIPRIDDVSIDAAVFIFTLAASIVTGLLVGLIPAIGAMRRASADALKENDRASGTSEQRRFGHALIVAEIALALILLMSAGLLGRSFIALTGQNPGFDTENVLAVSLQAPAHRYPNLPRLESFYAQVLERMRRIPGVEAAALSKNMPLNRGNSIREYRLEGEAETVIREAQYDVVSPGYFQALSIPLLRGRAFENTDRRASLPVAIIDEGMWRDTWPNQNPIGKRFQFADQWLTVVGVADGIRGSGLANAPRPGFYIPYQQRPDTPTALTIGRNAVFLIRFQHSFIGEADTVRAAVWDVDPQQPIADISTLENNISQAVSPQRFRAVLLGSFAAIALSLVIIGIYGVISYTVSRQTHELGIRMALGAKPGDVARMVMRRSFLIVISGIVLGLFGVLAVTRVLNSLLFSVTPTDPITLAAASLVLGSVALLASYLPARRATRVNPIEALRNE